MTRDQTSVVFLGVNDAGMRVYQWLCDREGVFVHSLLTTPEQLGLIEEVVPDFVVSCGFRHLVPEELLGVPHRSCLNLHPAYLPYNRGANPNVWSIVEDTPAGVTLHRMDAGIDTGDVLARREVEKRPSDTGEDLHRRLEDAQYELFTDTWPRIETGTIEAEPQNDDAGNYHTTKEFEELCELDFDEEVTVSEFLDRLRALTFPPYRNAFVEIDGERYYVDIDIVKE